jgi:hypothetical protein
MYEKLRWAAEQEVRSSREAVEMRLNRRAKEEVRAKLAAQGIN